MRDDINRRRRSLLPAIVLVLTLLSSSVAFAQGSIFGTVTNSDLSVPANGEISFFGYLDDTDEEIRIETSVGAGYDAGNWFDDFQNYLTEAPGNPYDYHFFNIANGEGVVLSKLIPNNSFQQEDILLAPVAWPAAPLGVSSKVVSPSAVVVSWNGVPGLTYHVYRRLATSNGSFFRIDDPIGSLANPGVADSFFVDVTVDGISDYHYLVIAENATGNLSPHSAILPVSSAVLDAPVVTAVDPSSGYTVGATPVTIHGSGFDMAAATVNIGGNWLTSVAVVSPFAITGLTPPGVSGPADVAVSNTASGLTSVPLAGGFTYLDNSVPVLAAIGTQNVTEGSNLNFIVTASDLDGDSLILSAESVPVNGSFVDNYDGSGVFNFDPDYTQAGSYFVTFIAFDGILADSEEVEIIVADAGNQTPVLASIGPQGVVEGGLLSFGVTASDLDGDSLILSAEDLPANATFNDNFDGTGTFDFSPGFDQAGGYTVTFIASDGVAADSEAVLITVADAGNQAPVLAAIGPQSITEGANLNLVTTASDIDGDSLIMSADNIPVNATFIDNFDGTGTFDFSPAYDQAGSYFVTFIASDGVQADSEEVEIVVADGGNQAPVLAAIGAQSVFENQNLNLVITATDIDSDPLAFSADNLPTDATLTDNLDGTATFEFTPSYTQSGVYNVTFIVSDGLLADSEAVVITVLEVGNQGPVFDPVDPQVVSEDSVLTLLIHATDDSDTISFLLLSGLPVYALVDSGNGFAVLEYTPDYYSAGVDTVRIAATDGDLPPLTSFLDIEIITLDANQPPTIVPIPPVSKSAGDSVNIHVMATDSTDADGGLLHLMAISKPMGSTFTDSGNGSGLFLWETTIEDTGSHQLSLLCFDNDIPAMSDMEIVDITVLVVNQAPVLDSIGSKSVVEGNLIEFTISATDPDGTIPTLLAEGLPRRSVLVDNGDGTALFSFDPDYLQAGLKMVKFIASDGDKQDFELVMIQVIDNPQRPILTIPTDPQVVTEGESIAFLISATDADSTIPILYVDSTTLPIGAAFVDSANGIGEFSFSPAFVQAGFWDVTFIALDETDLADSAVVTVEVLEAGNQTPLIVSPLDGATFQGAELQRLRFTVETTDADSIPPILSASPMPAMATFTDNGDFTGTFDWQVENLQAGTYPLTIYANDGDDPGIVTSITVTLEIADFNYPPDEILFYPITICFPGDDCYQEVDEGSVLEFRFYSSDIDGISPILEGFLYDISVVDTVYDTIVFVPPYEVDTIIVSDTAYSPLPANLEVQDLGNDTAIVTFAPDYTQAGSYEVMFLATDATDSDLYRARDFSFKVFNIPVAAVLEPIGDLSVKEGDTLDVQVRGYDPDGGPVTIYSEGLPPGASFTVVEPNTAINRLFYVPGYTDAGVYSVLFYVRENFAPNEADSEWVTITVDEAGPQAPVIDPLPTELILTVGDPASLWIQSRDADSGPPALSIEGDPEVPWNAVFADSGNGNGSFTYDPDPTQVDSTYLIRIIASDGSLTDTASVQISVIQYVSGDADGNGVVNISDVTYILAYIFAGGPEPQPYAAGDADGTGTVNISDASYLIAYIFGGGPPPQP